MELKPPPQRLFDDSAAVAGRANYLRFRLSPNSAVALVVGCVSVPSRDLFEALALAECVAVPPLSVSARLAVGLGVSQGWDRYIGERGNMLGVERFGACAPAAVLLREYRFTVDSVCARAMALLAA